MESSKSFKEQFESVTLSFDNGHSVTIVAEMLSKHLLEEELPMLSDEVEGLLMYDKAKEILHKIILSYQSEATSLCGDGAEV